MAKSKLGFSTGKGFIEKVDKAAHADSASSATSATNATYTDFTNAGWSSSVKSATLQSGFYQLLIKDAYISYIKYDGSITGIVGTPIVILEKVTTDNYQMGISAYNPTIKSGGILTIEGKGFAIGNSVIQEILLADADFKYRRIR